MSDRTGGHDERAEVDDDLRVQATPPPGSGVRRAPVATTTGPRRPEPRRSGAPGPGRVHDHDRFDDDDDDDLVDLPPPGSAPRWLVVIGVLVLLVGMLVGGIWWWYHRQLNPPGGPGAVVEVEIPRGASLSGIASILEREDVIANAMVFNFYASRQGVERVVAGVYDLHRNSAADDVLARLAEGPDREATATEVAKVTIPEGLRIDEIVQRTADQVPRLTVADLTAALDAGAVESSLRPPGQDSYEGLLFPATYDVGSGTDAVGFLSTLATEMERRVERLGVEAARASIEDRFGLSLTPYELLIVASLVQAEAGNAAEAPKIATVIYNRLATGSTAWKLGIDAADEYGARRAGMDVGAFRETTDPYNTRGVAGLPPTPIGAPGDYALSAAFEPAEGDWMYYVLTDEREHTFVVTDAEFQAAKQECIRKGLGCG